MKTWRPIKLAALTIRLAMGEVRSFFFRESNGYPTGPVDRSRKSTSPGVVFDLYRHKRRNIGTWVLIHGITANGSDDPRMVRFAHSLACSGVTCVVPNLEGLASCKWEPGDLDALVDVIVTVSKSYREPVGLIGFSYGGSYCLLAAARQDTAPHVHRVISIGAYHSMKTLLEEYIETEKHEPRNKGEWDMRIFRRLAFLRGYGFDKSIPFEVQQKIQSLLHRYCIDASLKEKKEFYHRFLRELDMTEIVRRKANPEIIRELSPEGGLSGLTCPVTLIHQHDDPVIPHTHAEGIYSELQNIPYPGPFRLVTTRLLCHVSLANIFYIRDAIRISLALAPILNPWSKKSPEKASGENSLRF